MAKDDMNRLMATPGRINNVADFETTYEGPLRKSEGRELLRRNVEQLADLQDMLYAYDRYAVLVVFQAMDAAGKDGTIKHVFSGVNPQGCQVSSFKQPSAEELDHDYLWRIVRRLPERGNIGVFNRSHYEDVLVARVNPGILVGNKLPGVFSIGDVGPDFWAVRYRQINDFERYLTETGTVIIKFFLNVSEAEQEKRFVDRLKDPTKNWKFSLSDIKERALWNRYMDAYSDLLTQTSTRYAPWYVIPADKKWYMRYAVSRILTERISELPLHYPELTEQKKQEIEKARELLLQKITVG